MTDTEQKQAARGFVANWKDKGYERGQSQAFWLSLLTRHIRKALIELFQVLYTVPDERDPYLESKLAAFPMLTAACSKMRTSKFPCSPMKSGSFC